MSGGAGEAQVSNEVDQVQVVNNVTDNMLPGSNKLIPGDKAAADETVKKQQEDAAEAAETLKKQQEDAAEAAETLKKQQEDAAEAAETLKKQQEDAAVPVSVSTVDTAAPVPVSTVDTAPVPVPVSTVDTAAPVPVPAPAPAPDSTVSTVDTVTAAPAPAPVPIDCKGAASIFSTVNPECIQLKPTPALTNLFTAAIYGPVSKAGAEIASDALEATGNAALVQLATTSAFTPEQVALLEKMSNSDDPKVREAVEKIQSRLSNAVAEGIETARKTVVPPLEKATGEVVNGVIVSFLNAVSDIPGVGFVLSALGLIDAAVKAASSATDIVEKAQEAAKPAMDAIAEVQNTVGKLASEATASVKPVMPIKSEFPKDEDYDAAYAKFEVEQQKWLAEQTKQRQAAYASAAKQSTLPKMQTGRDIDAQVITHDNQGITVGHDGGSRKRRRIHKLSRRIERTLRRVQKKYGFKDKGDFLRRTLKHHKHKR